MFGRVKPIEVPKGDPFRNDKLDRGKHIIRLTDEILAHAETPLVMTLASPWGSGKSSFVAMWKGYLEDKGHVCFLFDAWQHDFSREPLLDIIGEIGGYVAQIKEPTLRERCKKIITKFGEKAATIMGMCGDLAAVASCIMPGFAPIAGGLKAGKAATKGITSYLQDGHSDLKTALKDCKELLTELVGILAENRQEPVYFFIDELDRCEPAFAIRLLEAIKHFFDVKGIIFVLSVDKVQLSSMAKTRYGEAFDADGYLRRFIDIEYNIKQSSNEHLLRHLFENLYKNERNASNDAFFEFTITKSIQLTHNLNTSARTIEKALIKSYIPSILELQTNPKFELRTCKIGNNGPYSIGALERIREKLEHSQKWFCFIILSSILKEHNKQLYNAILHAYYHDQAYEVESDEYKLKQDGFGHMFIALSKKDYTPPIDNNDKEELLTAAIFINLNKTQTDQPTIKMIDAMLSLTDDISFSGLESS